MDDDDDVLYCYEIQLEESVRSKGLGKIKTFKILYIMYIYMYIYLLKESS